MYMITLNTDFANEQGETVVRRKDVFIEREA